MFKVSKMSSSQTMKEIATLKDSEAFKYFNQYEPACKFVKTHKREPSMHVIFTKSSPVEAVIGKKRPRED